MRLGFKFTFLLASFALMGASKSFAEDTGLGFAVGVGGDPFPSLLGANIVWQPIGLIRLHAGVGTMLYGSSVGAGAKLVFSLGSNLNFVGGLAGSRSNFFDFGNIFRSRSDFQASEKIWAGSANIALEWEANWGFIAGFGLDTQILGEDILDTPVYPRVTVTYIF